MRLRTKVKKWVELRTLYENVNVDNGLNSWRIINTEEELLNLYEKINS